MRATHTSYLEARPPTCEPRRVWLWLTFLIPLTIIASLALVVALGLFFNMTGEVLAPTAEEEALVLDIDHLSDWMVDYVPDFARETLTKTRYLDRSYELDYTYDVPDDENAPYLSYTLTFEPSQTDAGRTYVSYWSGTRVAFFAFGTSDVTIDERNDLFRWGDESRFGLLTTEGQPFGNVFVAREGNRVVYFLISGLYFDDAEQITALLDPYLKRLRGYSDT